MGNNEGLPDGIEIPSQRRFQRVRGMRARNHPPRVDTHVQDAKQEKSGSRIGCSCN